MAWRTRLKNHKKTTPKVGQTASLEAMIRAARVDDPGDRISDQGRGRILDAVLRGGPAEESLPALFTPTRRLIVAGALPLLLTAVLLVGLDRGLPAPTGTGDHGPAVAAFKQGDRVLFSIRNGSRQHVVYRSTRPDGFDSADGVAVADGKYEDGLRDQADLVFYRID